MEKRPLQYSEVDEVLISDHSDFGLVDVNHAIAFLRCAEVCCKASLVIIFISVESDWNIGTRQIGGGA